MFCLAFWHILAESGGYHLACLDLCSGIAVEYPKNHSHITPNMSQSPYILQKWSSGKRYSSSSGPPKSFLPRLLFSKPWPDVYKSKKISNDDRLLWFNKFWSHKNSKIKVDEGCWWYLFHETSLKYWEMISWVIYCLSPVKIKWKIDEESNSTIKKTVQLQPPKIISQLKLAKWKLTTWNFESKTSHFLEMKWPKWFWK